MSHVTMFPSSRNKWNKRMIETLRSIHPRPTYLEGVKTKNAKSGKDEVKMVRKTLSDSDITRLVTKNYNLTSGKDKDQKAPSTPAPQEASTVE